MPTLSDFKAETLSGDLQSLSEYAGKVVLVVNTASKCGFTPQYGGLERLWDRYADDGLVVLGFPCNQFGHQEPGDAEQIGDFCQANYGVTFPMFAKVDVNGPEAHPLYQWLRVREERPARRPGQVELHQVPHRQGRHRAQALRLDHQAGEDRGRASRRRSRPDVGAS